METDALQVLDALPSPVGAEVHDIVVPETSVVVEGIDTQLVVVKIAEGGGLSLQEVEGP